MLQGHIQTWGSAMGQYRDELSQPQVTVQHPSSQVPCQANKITVHACWPCLLGTGAVSFYTSCLRRSVLRLKLFSRGWLTENSTCDGVQHKAKWSSTKCDEQRVPCWHTTVQAIHVYVPADEQVPGK